MYFGLFLKSVNFFSAENEAGEDELTCCQEYRNDLSSDSTRVSIQTIQIEKKIEHRKQLERYFCGLYRIESVDSTVQHKS